MYKWGRGISFTAKTSLFKLFFFLVGCDWVQLLQRPLFGLLHQPQMTSDDGRWWLWSNRWHLNWQGKPKYSEKTCPRATFSTRNPTWPDLGLNSVRHGGKPVTNPLRYSRAWCPDYGFSWFSSVPTGSSFDDTSITPRPLSFKSFPSHATFWRYVF